MALPEEETGESEGSRHAPLPPRPDRQAEVEELRRKLRRLDAPAARPAQQPILYRRDLPHSGTRPAGPPATVGRPVALQEALGGIEVEAPHGGIAYLVAHRLEEWPRYQALHDAFHERFGQHQALLRHRLPEGCEGLSLEEVLLIDLETTGLSTSPLFLIGVLHWEDGRLVVRQYLARDYSEERATVSLIAEGLARKRLLVSFNGKSFDVPYLRMRAAANGIPLPEAPAHLDLLHECRRAWGHRLPDCKLQTLERYVCRRVRHNDIPGAEIPDAYHAFVRTGNAAQLARIVEHNRWDLATLAELLVRLPGEE